MMKKMLVCVGLALCLFSDNSAIATPESLVKKTGGQTGILGRMIVTSGNVTLNLDPDWLNGIGSETAESKRNAFRFEVDPNSFFTIRVFHNFLRGLDPGSMALIWGRPGKFPGRLNKLANQPVLEKIPSGGPFDLVIRDEKSGSVLFNIEGDLFEYDAAARSLSLSGGRLLVSEELAQALGRPMDAASVVGEISLSATVTPIEITAMVNGAAKSSVLAPRNGRISRGPDGPALGPELIVGDLPSMIEAGSFGTQIGLGIATTSCNNGDREVHFLALPDTDHSVISQNLYRMSGGSGNNDRFEQIGQGWVKHTFGADQDDDCGFGCTPAPDFTTLGVGCSDPYDAGENAAYSLLGSRAWVNPFTGNFPSTAANHDGHAHTGSSHRLLVDSTDLDTTANVGATYYAEATYDIRQEYEWCQANPGQCNMYNNASYRRFNVSGTAAFSFSGVGSTVRMTPVIQAWAGATINMIEPEPGVDGRAFIAYKVTNPSAGVWHYEYALYNRNLDRAIQSFVVPLGTGITLTNVDFHAPRNPLGVLNDGTLNNAGFSNAPWTSNQTSDAVTWSCETFAQNQNANAIRWSTMYNFRFDSNRPPYVTNATVSFFKAGTPITAEILGPAPEGVTPTPTPTPQPTATPTATPVGSATPSPTEPPSETPTPSPSPPRVAQATNLSTRLGVGTESNVGVGGFIITGSEPKQVLLRGIGPSLSGTGVSALPDPLLELHGSGGFVTITNNNWKDTQETAIAATGIAPANDLEAAILVTLTPGAYTAILSGNANTTGVGLVEIYDLSLGAASKMGNISTRAFVDTGSNIVIGGFILGNGSGVDSIVLRGIGPSLSGSGIPNPLQDPRLELRDSDGVLIAFDDNWQDDPGQAAIIMAAGLQLGNPSEAAIAASLSPGAYTALLMGVNNGTGVGLLEVYDNLASGPIPSSN